MLLTCSQFRTRMLASPHGGNTCRAHAKSYVIEPKKKPVLEEDTMWMEIHGYVYCQSKFQGNAGNLPTIFCGVGINRSEGLHFGESKLRSVSEITGFHFVSSSWKVAEVCVFSCFDPRVQMVLTCVYEIITISFGKPKETLASPLMKRRSLWGVSTVVDGDTEQKKMRRPFELKGKEFGLGSSLVFVTFFFF